jgi:hypothetical protein
MKRLAVNAFAFTLSAIAADGIAAKPAGGAPAHGHIVGNIDGISQDGDHYFISGWACQQGQTKSLAVHVYAEDPKDRAKRTLIIVQYANLFNEPTIGQACRDPASGKHRFVIMLPHGYGPQSTIYVHGIHVVDGVSNDAVAGSGKPLARLPVLDAPHLALPRLSGAYRSLKEHPRVFMTAADLRDLVSRLNRPGSYSTARFGLLAAQIKRDLGSGIDWDVTYAGCNGWIYNYVFSYEPQDHHEAEIRAELTIAPTAKAPAGAAVVAARLALYAALAKAGAALPAGAPNPDDAAALAKRILLAWADRGLPRDARGGVLPLAAKPCGPTAKAPTMTQPRDTGGLALGRGVLYSVQAQDLLQFFGALDARDVAKLDGLHKGLFELLRESANGFMGSMVFPYPDCARYNNITANVLASLFATARLLDDERKINAVLYGDDRAMPVLPSFARSFDRLIYGRADSLPECGENRYPDSLTSLQHNTDWQNRPPAPGEIADRGRNAFPGQGIGYPMFTLERLFDAAEVLRIAGFDPYGYRGAHQQSIEMTMQYYACYAKGAGFYKVVASENSHACPNAAQYYGKLVSGVDRMVLIGAYRFPQNSSITMLEADARTSASSGGFATDAILFGKWRD